MPGSPVFIVGTERSGSNLLRLILNCHSRITIPHPPHIVRYFHPLEAGYGDLAGDASCFARLVDDVLDLVRGHIHPWEAPIDRGRILERADPRNAFGVFVELYDQHLEWSGKERWGCKSTFLVDQADAVLDRFDDPKLILLVRDPRDVAASSRESVFNPCHPYFTARLWARQQRVGASLLGRLGPSTLHLLRYEQLVGRPEEELSRLCAFLGVDLEPKMLSHFESAEARTSSSLSRSWSNTGSPISEASVGRFRRDLSPLEVRLVESVAGPLMETFGYPTASPRERGRAGRYERLAYRLQNAAGRMRVELRSLLHDRNHWRRWKRDASMSLLGLRYRLLQGRRLS